MEYQGEIRVNCRQLVESITKKKVSEERINAAIFHLKDCIDYVTEHEVKISIDGLHHKFLIHAEHEKARQFRKLVDKYLQLTDPKGLTHPSWSILHLLFRLAYRPTDRPNYHFEFDSNVSAPPKPFDWGNYLTEDVVLPNLPKTDSPFSEDDDDLSDDEDTIRPRQEIVKTSDEISLFPRPAQVVQPTSPLNSQIQENYWDDDQKREWTEHQVLHEILWALQSKSSLFNRSRNGAMRIKPVGLGSLPAACLTEHLKTFLPLLEGLKVVNEFITNVTANVHKTHTLTHQACAKSLHVILMEFHQLLATFETRLVEQKVTTTLNDLISATAEWKAVTTALADIAIQINRLPITAENHIKSSLILSVLFSRSQQAQITSYHTVYPYLLRVFFSSLAPYLNIIDHWLTRGEIVDYYQEFIVRKKEISPDDEHFWRDSIERRKGEFQLEFMEAAMDDVLMAGRSVELLGQSGHLKDFVRQSNLQCGTLYDVFVDRFNRFSGDPGRGGNSPESEEQVQLEYQSENPLLNEAFRMIYNNLNRQKKAFLFITYIIYYYYILLTYIHKKRPSPTRENHFNITVQLIPKFTTSTALLQMHRLYMK